MTQTSSCGKNAASPTFIGEVTRHVLGYAVQQGGVGEELQICENISLHVLSQPTQPLLLLQCDSSSLLVNFSYLHEFVVQYKHSPLSLAIREHLDKLLPYVSSEVEPGQLSWVLRQAGHRGREVDHLLFILLRHFSIASSFCGLNLFKDGYSFSLRAGGSSVWPSWPTVRMA